MSGLGIMSAVLRARRRDSEVRNPMLPPGTNYCRCSCCDSYFRTVKAFDRHRVGVVVGVGRDRGCLPEAECLASGLEMDSQGYFRFPKQEFRNVHLRAQRHDKQPNISKCTAPLPAVYAYHEDGDCRPIINP